MFPLSCVPAWLHSAGSGLHSAASERGGVLLPVTAGTLCVLGSLAQCMRKFRANVGGIIEPNVQWDPPSYDDGTAAMGLHPGRSWPGAAISIPHSVIGVFVFIQFQFSTFSQTRR